MLRSGAIYFAGRMGAALIVLLSVAVYTRLLAPSEYGLYALVMSGGTMGYAVLLQWLTFSLARYLPVYQDRQEVVLSHAATGFVLIALGVVLPAVVLLPPVFPDLPPAILWLGIAFFVTLSFSEMTLVVFQLREKPGIYARYTLLRVAVTAAVGISLAWAGFGAVGLVLGLVLGNLSLILPNLFRIWRPSRPKYLTRGLFWQLAAYGFPFAMTGALAAVIHASDRYIIGALLGTGAAGLYAAPYDFAMRSLRVLMMVVAMASHPRIMNLFEREGRDAVLGLIKRQSELLLGIAAPAAIGCSMLAPAIASLVFGAEFRPAARELMPWVATATVVSGLQSFFLSLSFSLPKQTLKQTAVFLIGAVANVALNFLLIPRFGLLGAAYATLAAYVLIVVCSFLVGQRIFKLPLPTRAVLKIALASLALAAALWPVRDVTALLPVTIHGAIGMAAYVAIFCGLDVGETREPVVKLLRRGAMALRPGGAGRAG